ncbi:MAG TPA: glycosyltransferase family 2 protein [Solirubrobacteraceae bacterium]|nr:glycosyltransferase family 2 protein [Solirubrobacteraceae bacterium]
MRIIAMIQAYNEQRFIAACIEHLHDQGVEVYLIDNESEDDTVAIAERYVGRGVAGIETLPREGVFALEAQCARQEELAMTLEADWLMHHDADEMRVSPKQGQTLAEAVAEIDAAGYNAINFLEFTFFPTRESPDHDHAEFVKTMRHYYPLLPVAAHQVKAWKRQDVPVKLRPVGHRVEFPGLTLAPDSLYMRHYQFLSAEHARKKYVSRRFAASEIDSGFHGWRARIQPEQIVLPSEKDLRVYEGDHLLDPSDPLKDELLGGLVPVPSGREAAPGPWRRLKRSARLRVRRLGLRGGS